MRSVQTELGTRAAQICYVMHMSNHRTPTAIRGQVGSGIALSQGLGCIWGGRRDA